MKKWLRVAAGLMMPSNHAASEKLRVASVLPEDLPSIQVIYADGRERQGEQGSTMWPAFSDEAVLREIEARKLYGIYQDSELAGVFSVSYDDRAIWGERERGAHIYLHRIVRARTYRGRGILNVVLEWARAHCHALGRAGLRMDTWANNTQLIDYYRGLGFECVATQPIGVDSRLPAHYHGLEFALLEQPCEAVPRTPVSALVPDRGR